jgi:hypothetical protein
MPLRTAATTSGGAKRSCSGRCLTGSIWREMPLRTAATTSGGAKRSCSGRCLIGRKREDAAEDSGYYIKRSGAQL